MGGPPEYYSCRWSTKSNREAFQIVLGQLHHWLIREDDVHKSIKYNLWSSTPRGNEKLESAFEDAQKIAAGTPSIAAGQSSSYFLLMPVDNSVV
ncbi:hypothetical protein V6N13_047743 [Hibiscus sabdariffa]|uniref:YTH domain-containing family protein n=1 Tax=Hibiscus sabdariffa TaxID=183260 RepID=A0ABR2F573_9ROSI